MNYKTKFISLATMAILCLLFFTNTATMQAQNAFNTNIGILEFEKEIIAYGDIKYKADGERTFSFQNTGSAPIIIANIKSSCGCTIAKKPNKPIMPGEFSKITVAYATNRVGAFSKSITVISNASEPQKKLTIKGKVLPQETL